MKRLIMLLVLVGLAVPAIASAETGSPAVYVQTDRLLP